MSGLFNQIGLPPSLKAFTTGLQPGSLGPIPSMSDAENSLLSSTFAAMNRQGFEFPSIGNTGIAEGRENITKQMKLHQEQMSSIATSSMNELQLQTSFMREAGSGSSTPSVISARNSMYRTSSVDSQLALLRNEMVIFVFFR